MSHAKNVANPSIMFVCAGTMPQEICAIYLKTHLKELQRKFSYVSLCDCEVCSLPCVSQCAGIEKSKCFFIFIFIFF